MTKNIQKYLLLHHPIIWNVRLIPMLLILVAVHLVTFGLGYLFTDTSINDEFQSYNSDILVIPYFMTIIVSILLFILWSVNYNRNNGFRKFYPHRAFELYGEWLLILVITAGIACVPLSLTLGNRTKWQSLATEKEAREGLAMLDKASYLIPENITEYEYDERIHKPLPIPNDPSFSLDSLSESELATTYTNNRMVVTGYKGHSLLFAREYDEYYGSKDYGKPAFIAIGKTVKDWFRNGQRDSIYNVMVAFNRLQTKHNLTVELTPDQWMKRIYRPPFFPVDETTMIQKGDYYSSVGYTKSYDNQTNQYVAITEYGDTAVLGSEEEIDRFVNEHNQKLPKLPYTILNSAYTKVLENYTDTDALQGITLFCIYLSLVLSLFVFSFRATTGKSWLTALVIGGVLYLFSMFISIIGGIVSDGKGDMFFHIFSFYWLIIFAGVLAHAVYRMNNNKKGFSKVTINLLLWLIPTVLPLVYLIVESPFADAVDKGGINNGEDLMIIVLWINIPITIAAMAIVSVFVRKWKSIPEE